MGNSRQFASEYRFHPFEVDLDSRELRKHGVRLHLHDQPFQVLALLLTRRGEVVTREELRRALWASGTFVDFENGLNSAVNRLREALCDSAKHPRYIETIPRRGYRFIATLEPDPKPSNTGPPDHREGHPPHAATISNMSSNVFRGLMLTTGVLVLLALMPVAAWRPF